MTRLLALLAVLLVVVLTGCGTDDKSSPSSGAASSSASDKGDGTLTIYSGRSEDLVGPLLDTFEKQSGIEVKVRYGESAELAATIAEEGENSPAEVFFSQDAGALGAVAEAGLLAQVNSGQVDRRWVGADERWVGTSGRARVVAYSTERVKKTDLPDTIFDFTQPEWKGRIALAPTNASFQAFVSAMRLSAGDKRTQAWLEGIKANDPTLLDGNSDVVKAINSGEVDVGLVNHYYVYELEAETPGLKVANHFLKSGDPGSLVNVAGVGALKTGDAGESARLVTFLLSDEAQAYFAEKTFEYPLTGLTQPPDRLPPLTDLQGPAIELGELGEALPETTRLIDEVGLGA